MREWDKIGRGKAGSGGGRRERRGGGEEGEEGVGRWGRKGWGGGRGIIIKELCLLNSFIERGATALLVAVATRGCLAVAQANYCNSFQLTHMPRGNHAQSNASNGDQKEDTKL